MNLFNIITRFPDQQSCIDHLEKIRFGNEPYCPLCGVVDVAKKVEKKKIGRWNCHACRSSFNVLSGTIMQGTQMPLQKWFCAIGLIVNAKKSLSSCQLARDLDLTQPTAWYMLHRIRAAMASKQLPLLKGIIEADETYVGGRPRRRRNRKDNDNQKNGNYILDKVIMNQTCLVHSSRDASYRSTPVFDHDPLEFNHIRLDFSNLLFRSGSLVCKLSLRVLVVCFKAIIRTYRRNGFNNHVLKRLRKVYSAPVQIVTGHVISPLFTLSSI